MKKNESTNNRPNGERMIDAPFVFTDIFRYLNQLKQESAYEKNDRNAITVFKTDRLTEVLLCLHSDATIEDNSIDGIVIIQVIEGKIKLLIEDKNLELGPGQLISLHPNVKHSIMATKDSSLLLVNYEQ